MYSMVMGVLGLVSSEDFTYYVDLRAEYSA